MGQHPEMGVTQSSAAIPPHEPQAIEERGSPCAIRDETSPEPGMSRVLLGVQEPRGAGDAEGAWVMGAVEQDTNQHYWDCQSAMMHRLHKARAGLKLGDEAKDAQAA